ncbi:hypothetical protein ROA7450_03713 [Roseovarius albus]|uniref:Sel1 repeat protein n=1 Tax=Roseovarius albus TaxID=1247867 RepID=A0A1X7A2X2_9RHOB|nr:hypothetical protein ROA7450_03713 [Roseovarius albus]
METQDKYELEEAQKLLEMTWHCSNDDLVASIEEWARELLERLSNKGMLIAGYLLQGLDDQKNSPEMTSEEFDQCFLRRLKKGADDEIPEAMFYLAHSYWESQNYEEAASLYQKAASSGHVYAKWCYGLALIAGRGVEKDEVSGLKQIEESAAQKFEGAIQFMANAYAGGLYGYSQNTSEAAKWQRMLGSEGVIHY